MEQEPMSQEQDGRINTIADGLFDHLRLSDKIPPMGQADFREVIGSAIAQWVTEHAPAKPPAGPNPSSDLLEHLDSLDGQLAYFIGRVKALPNDQMAALVTDNLRERLKAMRALVVLNG